jgi:predicted RNase H-like HicB family nuclease
LNRKTGGGHEYEVHTFFDGEAKVWVAESDDVPGLVTEAGSIDELISKLRILIPELLEENGRHPSDIAYHLTGDFRETIHAS